MIKKLLLTLCLGLFGGLLFAQTVTFPRNDVADERLNLYAFTNATIYVSPTEIIEGGILLIRGAFVEAVGKDIKVPAGAIVIDCKGKRIYPGLVDIDSDYGMPEVRRGGGGGGFAALAGAAAPAKKGAYGWNPAIQPETNAEEVFTINATRADELRKLGFGAVLSHAHDGIARGTSALIAPIEDIEQNAILKGKVSAHYSFNKGSSTQAYPNSMMGSVALLRQSYYDAQWYKRALNKTEYNISLDHFNHIQSLPQIFDADDRFGILRADKVGKEFGVQYIIKTAGDEYQRLDEVKATGASLIVPLTFPQAFDVEDPWDAGAVSLAEMKHWEMAPANAGTLSKAGINFALTSAGLRNRATDFWTNLRKAIEYGLSETDALKALTTTPAALLKCEEKIGCLKPGCYANLLITSDNLFKTDNVIHENWIKGKRHVLNDMTITDIRGQYDMKVGERAMKLNISGKVATPEYQIVVSDTIKITPKATRYNNLLSMTYSMGRMPGTIRLSGYLEGKDFKGEGEMPNGNPVKWSAVYKEAAKETPARPDTTRPRTPELGKLLFPFVAFGNEQKPKQETILVKNTTVWTNEKDGILQNTDVLLENGKISKVGKNLSAANAKTIDGTGKHLTNGIFDEHSHIALFAINEGGQTVTAEVRQGDVINSDDINIYRQLAGGVTSAQLLHGSANSIGGQSALIKLKWGESPEELKIKGADGFIKFALGENVTRKSQQTGRFGGGAPPRYPISRMGVEQVMMDAFARARDYEKDWKAYEAVPAKDRVNALPPRRDIELDALVEILNKKRFITCHSYVQSEINMLMKVAETFGFRINTFTHILEGYKVADIMQKHGSGGSSFSDWWSYKMEVRDAIPHNPAMLHKAGVVTSINSDDAEMARRLNQEAAKSVQYGGLSEEDAWKMVTLNPAKLMHLENRMGSIKPGKEADIVLWNNNPLSIYAKPDYTIVDGTIYFDAKQDEQKQKDLDKERARLIQKMLAAKAGGSPTVRPQFRRQHIFHCEDEGDISSLGEGNH